MIVKMERTMPSHERSEQLDSTMLDSFNYNRNHDIVIGNIKKKKQYQYNISCSFILSHRMIHDEKNIALDVELSFHAKSLRPKVELKNLLKNWNP